MTKSHPSDPKIKTPLNQGADTNLHYEHILRSIFFIMFEPLAQRARRADEHVGSLAMAFRGELVPEDPNYEPASVLLERIRAEREAEKASKPKR